MTDNLHHALRLLGAAGTVGVIAWGLWHYTGRAVAIVVRLVRRPKAAQRAETVHDCNQHEPYDRLHRDHVVAPVEHIGATLAGLNVPAEVSAEQARADEVIELDRAFAELLAALRPKPEEHEHLNAVETWLADELAVLVGAATQLLELDGTAELEVLGLGQTGEYALIQLEGASR